MHIIIYLCTTKRLFSNVSAYLQLVWFSSRVAVLIHDIHHYMHCIISLFRFLYNHVMSPAEGLHFSALQEYMNSCYYNISCITLCAGSGYRVQSHFIWYLSYCWHNMLFSYSSLLELAQLIDSCTTVRSTCWHLWVWPIQLLLARQSQSPLHKLVLWVKNRVNYDIQYSVELTETAPPGILAI